MNIIHEIHIMNIIEHNSLNKYITWNDFFELYMYGVCRRLYMHRRHLEGLGEA